ncbi:MAG: ABC transporter ATP-binding protein/permease [Mycoplasmataceae bacterium]|nr:ABC transporter ATP-binding protein/permease [Mycoplasmataceae bacterium]
MIVFLAARVYIEITIPDWIEKITSSVTKNESLSAIIFNGGMLICLVVVDFAILVTTFYLSAVVGARFSKILREKVFEKINSFSNNEINKFSTNSLITRCSNDVTMVQNSMTTLLRMGLFAPMMLSVGILKFFLHSNISVSTILIYPVIITITTLFLCIMVLLIFTLPKTKVMQKLIDKLNKVSRNQIAGIRVIRAFNAEEHEKKNFIDVNDCMTKNTLFTNSMWGFAMPLIDLFSSLQVLLLFWVGLLNAIDLASINGTVQLAAIIFISFLMLIMLFVILPRGLVSAKRINEILETEVTIKYQSFDIFYDDFKSIEFNNVTFGYPNAAEPILKNLNFSIGTGQTIAIIGANGSGKTTLAMLMARFYDVVSGEIKINNVNIKEYSQKDISKILTIVPQKAALFNDTILNNICYGIDNKNMTVAKNAAEIACADFIEKLDDKYQTIISQNATNLSGGQKQRVSIARAIAKNTPVIIFDDSFSALDYKTDLILRENLARDLKETTKIIIAQRINTILNADKIIVLEKGEIVGIGSHNELLNNCQIYKDIVYSQINPDELR